jgi:hypothetical protein
VEPLRASLCSKDKNRAMATKSWERSGERDEMTINIGLAEPGLISEDPQQTREAKRRQHVITLVALATAARIAVDRRTLAGVMVLVVGLVAAKRMAQDRGTPGLEWYKARGREPDRR